MLSEAIQLLLRAESGVDYPAVSAAASAGANIFDGRPRSKDPEAELDVQLVAKSGGEQQSSAVANGGHSPLRASGDGSGECRLVSEHGSRDSSTRTEAFSHDTWDSQPRICASTAEPSRKRCRELVPNDLGHLSKSLGLKVFFLRLAGKQ